MKKLILNVLAFLVPLLFCFLIGGLGLSALERKMGCAPWHDNPAEYCRDREDFSPCAHYCDSADDTALFDKASIAIGISSLVVATGCFLFFRRRIKKLK